jgi:hypothetical protein
MEKIDKNAVEARRAECISLLTGWAEEMSAKARIEKLSEGLLQGVTGGSL